MDTYRKPVAALGKVQPLACDKWRVRVGLHGKIVYGPFRLREADAQADLQLAQAAADRDGMATVLTHLKCEAEIARRSSVEQSEELRATSTEEKECNDDENVGSRQKGDNAVLEASKQEQEPKCMKLKMADKGRRKAAQMFAPLTLRTQEQSASSGAKFQ